MNKIILLILLSFNSTLLFSQEKVEIENIRFNHRSLYTEIIINATPEEVWEVLTDFESYPKWAVFFKGMTGDIRDQGEVIALFQMNPKKDKLKRINHTIFYEEEMLFGWSDKVFMRIIDNHKFIVEDAGDGQTRFIQSDEFKKGYTWLLGRSLTDVLSKKYPTFNRSLKAEVERRFY